MLSSIGFYHHFYCLVLYVLYVFSLGLSIVSSKLKYLIFVPLRQVMRHKAAHLGGHSEFICLLFKWLNVTIDHIHLPKPRNLWFPLGRETLLKSDMFHQSLTEPWIYLINWHSLARNYAIQKSLMCYTPFLWSSPKEFAILLVRIGLQDKFCFVLDILEFKMKWTQSLLWSTLYTTRMFG